MPRMGFEPTGYTEHSEASETGVVSRPEVVAVEDTPLGPLYRQPGSLCLLSVLYRSYAPPHTESLLFRVAESFYVLCYTRISTQGSIGSLGTAVRPRTRL
jgi:hypothetical protein